MKIRNSKFKLLALIALTAVTSTSYASVLQYTKDSGGITARLDSGKLRLEVCDDRTIHVLCSPNDQMKQNLDFVVNKKWDTTDFTVADESGKLILKTALMGVELDKETASITFIDSAGKVILKETGSDARVITKVDSRAAQGSYRAQQTFVSPENEYLYGMAQAQDGIWNWRGMPIELRQVNTQAAIPVLVSSKGYGILWNNASLTDFNPVDNEVKLSYGGNDNQADGPTATEQLTGQNRNQGPRGARTGSFTTTEAGEYVFFVKDGDRRNEIGIEVNGTKVIHLNNMWVPYTASGKISLPANTECSVKLLGGGRNAKMYARALGNTTTFRSHYAESIDYYFFYGPDFDNIVASYRNATGEAPLWPKWAYGFWQCRERYSSSQQIIDTVSEFRKRQIPVDLIVQDWQYWGPHGWGAYQWDTSKYPDPELLISSLHEQNVKFMISVWSNPQGIAGNDIKANKYNLAGTDWVDQTNPAARELRWKYLNDAFFRPGTDAWWQDATEPGDDGNAMEGKTIFAGSGDLLRNAYPLFANQTVYDGQRQTDPEKRVCTLTRSAFPGQQRFATALWSGDISGDWISLQRQIPAGLHVCLTGLPYWTTDCGGFFRPRDQYQSDDFADLYIRWFQYSTFCPVQRIHGYQSETEFWKFPKAMDSMVKYNKFRYRLLPYIYSLAWQITNDGYTMMRALPMDFSGDEKVYDIWDQYMFGPAFLVSPVLEPKATSRKVYLPAQTRWVNFWTGAVVDGGKDIDEKVTQDSLPLYIPCGSIIPLGPDLQYANEKQADPIELRIYPGANGEFTLYEDEGDSYRYEKGMYSTITFKWDDSAGKLTIGKRNGEFPGMLKNRTFRIVWVTEGQGVGILHTEKPDQTVSYNGQEISVSRTK